MFFFRRSACGDSFSELIKSFVTPIALRKAKIVCNFGLSECNRVKETIQKQLYICPVRYFHPKCQNQLISHVTVSMTFESKGKKSH